MLLFELLGIQESPMRIPSLVIPKLENYKENKKLFKTLAQRTDKQFISHFNNVELWKICKGRETEIFGVIPSESYVGYYVRWELQESHFADTNWCTQVLVWAGVSPQTKGLPDKIFFEYIIPETGTVVSDGEQTVRGEHFWQRMIATAFSTGNYKVYLIDFNRKKTKRISTYEDYRLLYESEHSPWGNKRGFHEGLRIAISDYDFCQE
jgi:hypothetical protein